MATICLKSGFKLGLLFSSCHGGLQSTVLLNKQTNKQQQTNKQKFSSNSSSLSGNRSKHRTMCGHSPTPSSIELRPRAFDAGTTPRVRGRIPPARKPLGLMESVFTAGLAARVLVERLQNSRAVLLGLGSKGRDALRLELVPPSACLPVAAVVFPFLAHLLGRFQRLLVHAWEQGRGTRFLGQGSQVRISTTQHTSNDFLCIPGNREGEHGS